VTELVRAHHGTLSISSKQGHGTAVVVTLPLARPYNGQPLAQGPGKQPPGARRRHVSMIAKTDGQQI
jgi:hypothetical protein